MIYVISHKKNVQRREQMAKCLKGFEYSFFDAIYPLETRLPFKPRFEEHLDRRSLSFAELGASLSHRKIWKEFLSKSSSNYCIIFEDDVQLKSSKLSRFLSQDIDCPWDLLLFGSNNGLAQPVYKSCKYCPGIGFVGVPYYETAFCAYGYAITRQGARTMLAATKKFRYPIDYWSVYREESNIDLKVVFPNFVKPSRLARVSSIQKDKRFPTISEKLLYSLFYFFINIAGCENTTGFKEISFSAVARRIYRSWRPKAVSNIN